MNSCLPAAVTGRSGKLFARIDWQQVGNAYIIVAYKGACGVAALSARPKFICQEVFSIMTPMEQLKAMVAGKRWYFIVVRASATNRASRCVGGRYHPCDQKKSLMIFGDYAATIKRAGHRSEPRRELPSTASRAGYHHAPWPGYFEAFTGHQGHQRGAVLQFCLRDRGYDRPRRQDHHHPISKFYEAAPRRVIWAATSAQPMLQVSPTTWPWWGCQLQLISIQSYIFVVTNVTPNLDHHKDMQEYIDAKRAFFAGRSHLPRRTGLARTISPGAWPLTAR